MGSRIPWSGNLAYTNSVMTGTTRRDLVNLMIMTHAVRQKVSWFDLAAVLPMTLEIELANHLTI